MEFFLLKIVAFLRPIFFIEVGLTFGGLNLFELAAILSFAVLAAVFLSNTALTRRIRLSAIDFIILALSVWCITSYAAYIDKAHIEDLTRFLIPMFTYSIAKNILRDREQYRQMLFVMILGSILPITLSAILTALGYGVDKIGYFTGIARYEGVYAGPHSMAHNATFLLMLMALYAGLARADSTVEAQKLDKAPPTSISKLSVALFVLLGSLSLYCLYEARVRTAILGLVVFTSYYLYVFNKRLLVVGAATGISVAILLSPILIPRFLHDFHMVSKGEWATENIGSGRPAIWIGNLREFSRLTIDQQLAGVGIGNRVGIEEYRAYEGEVRESHNDFLEVLVQTGMVGFILFLALQLLFFRAILNLEGKEKHILLAIFLAVLVMNFVSNSYVSRFGLGQMYFLLFSYVELPRRFSAKK